MNKRLTNRLLALALAWWLIFSFALPAAVAAEGEDQVTISTAQDLRQLAGLCALDTWSQGKTVVLTADLDLEEEEFSPIPTFGGVFLGQGHTISGLRITAAGSTQGLFRYIQPGAVVQDLTVQGTVAPQGTRSTVGGIVGENAGTLSGCSFQGVVKGKSQVGGVAGRNSESGQLVECSAAGSVSGESATGGIAGRNFGLLLSCENSAGVNLTQQETGLELTDAGAVLDPGTVLEDRTAAGEESTLLTGGCSDTGGIVGRSTGVVQSCVNNGAVGYPHVGYNTGGIAGRQSGYLAGCVNNGTVYGRKDVGGIVGQAEPYLVLDPGPQTLDRLRTELDTLDRLIDRALNDAQRTGDAVSAHLTAMGEFTGTARESSKRLLDRTVNFVDSNVEELNLLAADVTNALDKISPAMDDLSDAGRQLERLSLRLDRAFRDLEDAADIGGTVFDVLRSSAGELRQGQTELSAAMEELQQGLDAIHNGLFPGGFPSFPSLSELASARQNIRRAFDRMQSAGDRLDTALSTLQRALTEAGNMSDQLGDAMEDLQDAARSSAAIGLLLKRAFRAIGDGVDQLTRNGPAQFTNLGEEAQEASDSLYSALSGLSGEMEALNRTAQQGNDTLISDLRSVSRQFSIICNVMMDAIENMDERRQEGIEGLVQDTSEEDIAATREGKVADCRNTGCVEGDRNVGGMAGAVAIELDLDPEDDTTGPLSFGASYETKAVLQECINYGGITAKKDCVGGLAGRMDLGTALDCQNYGPVESAGGDYVGGVAGYADAPVRRCWSKSALSGKNYIGGVAGWASKLRDCRAIATINQGTECLGAIAGGVEPGGILSGCCFVDTGVAGVDGVSYAGRAEPVSFDTMSQLEDVPVEFISFALTLKAEGKTVAQIPFLYGDDLSRVELPPVPALEGCYGVWPEYDPSGTRSDLTLEAVYAPWITLAASVEQSGRLSLALAEGQFTGEAVLHVTESAQTPPKQNARDSVTWDISLSGSGLGSEDTLPLRLLSPGGGAADVWQYQNGQWVEVDAVTNGQYLLLSMQGTQGTFFLQSRGSINWKLILPAAGGAVGLAAVLLIAARAKKKKDSSKKKQAVKS